MADEEAGIQERFVFGSMWKTCALHVNIGCSLRSIIIQINNNESNNTFISLHQSFSSSSYLARGGKEEERGE